VPTQVDYDDYRDVGGIKVPRWTFTVAGRPRQFRVDDVKFNGPISGEGLVNH